MIPEPTLPEHVAKRVLSRAVELDHIRAAHYTMSELRSIAAEVGVSEAAFEQAFRELEPATSTSASRGGRGLFTLAAVGGAMIGVVVGAIDAITYFISSPLGMGVTLMVGGAVAVLEDYRRPARGLLRFQLKNGVLWLTFVAGWSLATSYLGGAGPLATTIMMRVSVVGCGLGAILGSIVPLAFAWRGRAAAGSGPFADTAPPLRRRVAEKLKHWIDLWASRSLESVEQVRTPLTR